MKDTTKKIEFNKKISLDFSGGEITGNAGLLAIFEFCKKLQLETLLGKYLPEIRQGDFTHTKDQILFQIIMRIIAGFSSNNSAIFLQKDPVFQTIHNGKIASSATCSRLKQTLNYADVSALQKIENALFFYDLEKEKPQKVIIDLDSTKDPASENLEGSSFIPHYGVAGFSPLFAFNGINGDMLKAMLKPGNTHCSTFALSFISKIIGDYQKSGITDIILRGDSAFSCNEIMKHCEQKNVIYTFKMKNFQSLIEQVSHAGVRGKSVFTEFFYKANAWEKERRIIACIDWVPRETQESKLYRRKNKLKNSAKQCELFPVYSFIVTNDTQFSPEEVFSLYNGRATIENSIEEAKNGFEIDHLSQKHFTQNSAQFHLHVGALQIVQLFRKYTMAQVSKHKKRQENTKRQDSKKKHKKFKKAPVGRKEITVPHVQTIREKFFQIPARLVKSGRKFFYKCSRSFPYQEEFFRICKIIQELPFLKIV